MKFKLFAIIIIAAFMSCGGSEDPSKSSTPTPKPKSMVSKEKPVEQTDPITNKGIGPVKSIVLEALDQKLADEGRVVYKAKCTACHKTSKKFIGPSPAGIMERRTPEWIMNMILNPDEMLQKDPIAKQLLAEYSAPMANQNLTEAEARSILEYFRTL